MDWQFIATTQDVSQSLKTTQNYVNCLKTKTLEQSLKYLKVQNKQENRIHQYKDIQLDLWPTKEDPNYQYPLACFPFSPPDFENNIQRLNESLELLQFCLTQEQRVAIKLQLYRHEYTGNQVQQLPRNIILVDTSMLTPLIFSKVMKLDCTLEQLNCLLDQCFQQEKVDTNPDQNSKLRSLQILVQRDNQNGLNDETQKNLKEISQKIGVFLNLQQFKIKSIVSSFDQLALENAKIKEDIDEYTSAMTTILQIKSLKMFQNIQNGVDKMNHDEVVYKQINTWLPMTKITDLRISLQTYEQAKYFQEFFCIKSTVRDLTIFMQFAFYPRKHYFKHFTYQANLQSFKYIGGYLLGYARKIFSRKNFRMREIYLDCFISQTLIQKIAGQAVENITLKRLSNYQLMKGSLLAQDYEASEFLSKYIQTRRFHQNLKSLSLDFQSRSYCFCFCDRLKDNLISASKIFSEFKFLEHLKFDIKVIDIGLISELLSQIVQQSLTIKIIEIQFKKVCHQHQKEGRLNYENLLLIGIANAVKNLTYAHKLQVIKIIAGKESWEQIQSQYKELQKGDTSRYLPLKIEYQANLNQLSQIMVEKNRRLTYITNECYLAVQQNIYPGLEIIYN
eukprot:403354601